MDTSFSNLARGNRLTSQMGLVMDNGYAYRYPGISSRDYAYVEIPIKELYNPSDESVLKKALRNQYIQVIPACTINVKGRSRVEVVPNRELSKYGTVQASYYVESEEGKLTPSFYIQLRKDLDVSDVDFAVRLYMLV